MNNGMDRNFHTSSQLNKFPVDWKLKPFWSITKKKSETNNEGLDLLSVYLNQGVVRFDDVNEKRTNVTSEDTSKYQKVERGNLVLNNQQAWRGSVGVSRFEGIVSPAYIVLELSEELETGYSNYLFRDQYMVDNYAMSSKGVGSIQRNIFFPILRTTPVPIPPFQEQELISRYLDKKTNQIDSLVDKIQKRIELLKEQRTSLINHYVTNGLDPNAEMKDSGIEWVGCIPSSWNVKPVWSLSKIVSRTNEEDKDLLSVFLDKGVVKFSDVGAKRTNVTSESLEKYQLVKPGNLVLNNQQAWRGSVGVSKYEGIVSPAYFILELNKELDPDFANYLFRDQSVVINFLTSSKGVGTIQRNLYFPHFSRTKICVPPLTEQRKIVDILDTQTKNIDEISVKLSNKIDLIKEYRHSLISAVVTGKVKVTEDMI